jgi:uncharacterized repeat protein (TIGR01451 family)
VITSWRFQTDSTTVSDLKLKVGRGSGTTFAVVGESAAGAQTPSAINGPYPARIAVQANDIIGLYTSGTGDCSLLAGASDTFAFKNGDQPPGGPGPYITTGNAKFPVEVKVEPDADGDGFGDETQDKCLGTPGSVQGCPNVDLSITKTASAATAIGGSNVTYTLVAKNNGSEAAPGVVVADALPPGTSLVSAVGGVCSGSGPVKCSVGTLASGATATVTLVAKMTSTGTKTNTATIASTADPTGTGDANHANDSALASTVVTAPPFSVKLKGRTFKVKKGAVSIKLSSDQTAGGTLKLTDVIDTTTGKVLSAKSHRKRIVLGKVTFSIAAGQTKSFKIHLTKKALKLLNANTKLKATLSAISTDSFGTNKTTKKKVTLKK